jgi:hypothetical protein
MPGQPRAPYTTAILLGSTAWVALMSPISPVWGAASGKLENYVVDRRPTGWLARPLLAKADTLARGQVGGALQGFASPCGGLHLIDPCTPMSPAPPYSPPPPCCTGHTCFPAGTMVEMADGRFQAIEHVNVGDLVRGRYGEANEVLALDRPLLGMRPLFVMNGEHRTTGEHTHWTKDGPTVIDLEGFLRERSTYHPVMLDDGSIDQWLFVGLTRPVTPMRVGVQACYRDGFKRITSIEPCDPATAPPELQLFNLVLGGSHTMRLDGYLVTGWPTESDFDYDRWRPRPGLFLDNRRPQPFAPSFFPEANRASHDLQPNVIGA